MAKDDERLIELATAIGDDTPVDWERERISTPALEALLAGLREVESVAAAQRVAAAGFVEARSHPGGSPLFTWGRLQVLEKLGEGSFGEVYRAWEPGLQREVALKLRRGGQGDTEPVMRRFLDEARRLARVRHPHVVTVYGADLHEGRAGLWMDLVDGRTLEQLLGSQGSLGAREATLVGLDLCRALAAIHAAGMVHGDLKASNVMREHGGRLVVMDFGSVSEPGDVAWGMARSCTPLVCAPEVLDGRPVSAAADLYALGVLLFRLVTGRYPVAAESLEDLRDKLARGERTALRELRPDLPTAFVQVVERALAPDPSARHASAGAMETALAESLDVANARPASVRPLRAALVLLVLVVVAGTAWWGSRRPWETVTMDRTVIGEEPEATGVPGIPSTGTPAGGSPGSEADRTAEPKVRDVVDAAPVVAAPDVRATLFRSAQGTHEPLSSGGKVQAGDHLFLDFECDEPLHVYVLNEDRQGAIFALFPVSGSSLSNPLAPGSRHRLPGVREGEPLDWIVTTAGGRERFLIAASPEPIPEIDAELALIPQAGQDRPASYARLSGTSFARYRGVGGLGTHDPSRSADQGSKLAALARSLARAPRKGIWIREIEVDNPGP